MKESESPEEWESADRNVGGHEGEQLEVGCQGGHGGGWPDRGAGFPHMLGEECFRQREQVQRL